MAGIVEDVLAVVGGVDHGGAATLCRQLFDDAAEQQIRLTYRVVVGVDELRTIFALCSVIAVVLKIAHEVGITVGVAEMGAVGV